MKIIPGMKGNKSSSKFLLLVLTISIVFGSLFLITSALGVKYTYSNQLWDGTAKSSCSTCGMLSSDQYVYYPSTEGYSTSVVSGYVFSKSFVLEDYINYNDMSRYYKKYNVYLIDKATNEVLYASGEKTFAPRMTSASTSVTESFSVTITKSRVVQMLILGSTPNSYGIFYEMEYNTGHRPTWAFFVNNAIPSGFTCGGSFICPTGYYCSNGTCMPTIDINSNPSAVQCYGSSGCSSGYSCLNGVCQPNSNPDEYNEPVTTITDPASSGPVTIIPVTTTPSGSSTSPTGNTVTEPDNTDDGNDVSGGGTGNEPAPTYDMFEGSCSEWANNSLLGLGKIFPSVLGPFTFILTVLCWASRLFVTITFLPFIITANIHYAFAGILCLGSYAGLFANALPVAVILLFLLTCLVPDDIVSAIIVIILTFFLGTTVPAGAIASVPLIAWVAGSAILPAFMSNGIVSSVQLGGGAIIVGIIILCLWNIFANVDTGKVLKLKNGGNTDLKITEEASITSAGIKGIRVFLAEVTLILIGLMYVECKTGQPLYTLTMKFITAIPQMLEQLAGVLF